MEIRETTAGPLYLQLARTLRSNIVSGRLAPGAKLPSEAELQADTGLSRSTVRKALDMLVDDGFITKERGRGAFVSRDMHPTEDRPLFSSLSATVECQGGVLSTKLVDATREIPPTVVAAHLALGSDEAAVKLVRLRYLNGEPLCIETTYLPERFSALLDEGMGPSLYQTLRERFHEQPGRGRKTFEVCFATTQEAFLLDVERGAALILITDFVYDDAGRPLHVSKRIMRTDRTKYVEPI